MIMAASDAEISICIPKWDDLRQLIKSARESLILCSPYISTEGINQVFDSLGDRLSIEIITRISPSDWANGISDPVSLVTLLELLSHEQWPVTLKVHQRLHAKAYIADASRCLVGSANLSGGGFDHNFELIVVGTDTIAVEARRLIQDQLRIQGHALEIPTLADWVRQCADVVAGSANREEESNLLAEPQRMLDRILGRGRTSLTRAVRSIPLSDFVDWLQQNTALRGADVLLDRHENRSGHNLQGHVKQTFAASQLFLHANRGLWGTCRELLQEDAVSDVPALPEGVINSWNAFVDQNADYRDDDCDFAVLSGYLPPSLGGTRTGGGGGSSTLKRMIPLVAEYLHQTGSQQ